VGATGFEPPADSTEKTPVDQSSAAFSGAVLPKNDPPQTVETLAAELMKLSPTDRERLAAMLLGQKEKP
jgi:hypothetical protein